MTGVNRAMNEKRKIGNKDCRGEELGKECSYEKRERQKKKEIRDDKKNRERK